MNRLAKLTAGLVVALGGTAHGGEPTAVPRPIPLTRPEMKQLLEDMKARTPRIPLPELTAEEKAKLGEREAGYEGRLRRHYMGRGEGQGGGASGFGLGREPDPNMSLDYKFKTQLFWIVSRVNNCQY
jgi:hypothetical protein